MLQQNIRRRLARRITLLGAAFSGTLAAFAHVAETEGSPAVERPA